MIAVQATYRLCRLENSCLVCSVERTILLNFFLHNVTFLIHFSDHFEKVNEHNCFDMDILCIYFTLE